jgi:hypothetical protein
MHTFKIDINQIKFNPIEDGLVEIIGLDRESETFILQNYRSGTQREATRRFSYYMKNILMGYIGKRMNERQISLVVEGDKMYLKY